MKLVVHELSGPYRSFASSATEGLARLPHPECRVAGQPVADVRAAVGAALAARAAEAAAAVAFLV